MKSTSIFTALSFTIVTMLLSLGVGSAFAAESAPMTPELAAKGARVKTQQSKKITQAQRQAAADAIKAERLKLHQLQQSAPQPTLQTPAPAPAPQ
jgi:hypothetical protein